MHLSLRLFCGAMAAVMASCSSSPMLQIKSSSRTHSFCASQTSISMSKNNCLFHVANERRTCEADYLGLELGREEAVQACAEERYKGNVRGEGW